MAIEPTHRVARTDAGPKKAKNADQLRAQVAQWAIKQADDPNIGYSQGVRDGQRVSGTNRRYYDCSSLVFHAYEQAGIKIGGSNTSAMQSTASQWADPVPKDFKQMKAGDIILMNGHVVMYTGNGRCVAARTNNGNSAGTTDIDFQNQVLANMDASTYLNRSDAVVLRPRVSAEEVRRAPAAELLHLQSGPPASAGGGISASTASSYAPSREAAVSAATSYAPQSWGVMDALMFLSMLYAALPDWNAGSESGASWKMLKGRFPDASPKDLENLLLLLKSNPALQDQLVLHPGLLDQLAHSPSRVRKMLEASGDFHQPEAEPLSLNPKLDQLPVDPQSLDPQLVAAIGESRAATDLVG